MNLNNGFAPSPDLQLVGTTINQQSRNVVRSRKSWDELPLMNEAVAEVSDSVCSENRADEMVSLDSLMMAGDGNLVLDEHRIGVEQPAFRQLCQRIGIPGGSQYLAACPPGLRATNLNQWLPQARRDSKLRLRTVAGRRTMYAAVSPSYAEYDVPELLTEVSEMISGEARVEASYDGLKLRFRAILETDVPVSDVGDVFKAGIEIASADDGTGALRISSILWKAMCLNLMVFSEKRTATVKRVHRGNGIDMAAALYVGVREAKKAIGPFTEYWSKASHEVVVKSDSDREKLLELLFERKFLQTPGVRAKEAIMSIQMAWDREPGSMKTDLINAVTRAAHEGAWANVATAEALEAQAGRLLTARLPS